MNDTIDESEEGATLVHFVEGLAGVSDFIMIILAISTGLLTLVGLISIYISINLQHRIEKAQELLWDLNELSYPIKPKEYLGYTIIQRLTTYRQIRDKQDDITLKIAKLARNSIYSVSSIWAFIILFSYLLLDVKLWLFLIVLGGIVIFFMIKYAETLNMFKGIFNKVKRKEIPTYDDLLNVDIDTDLFTLGLASNNLELCVEKKGSTYYFYLELPLDFKNIILSKFTIYEYDQRFKEDKLVYEEHDRQLNQSALNIRKYRHTIVKDVSLTKKRLEVNLIISNNKESIAVVYKEVEKGLVKTNSFDPTEYTRILPSTVTQRPTRFEVKKEETVQKQQNTEHRCHSCGALFEDLESCPYCGWIDVNQLKKVRKR
ncbi:hypothetical protein [Evansella cellulosilytica]|uniref:Uncharacterized protein n=1 Tax=Evansella cellulosilytica (strain ATCC 21833 / DSM 2522 / FERM P-1141 / JCM 9156 / N-4) TaxID=649639 RepID=E6TR10_EVAC2|nr:hypothetical protein [Evansella cellulosilytica]ADU29386.1 hypothetical protein Bcell_1116 [Evansella cellulosilytica DSM 2522]